VDFAEVEAHMSRDEWDRAAEILAAAARALEAAGADFVVICTNTLHKVADEVQAAIGIPILHIVDVTAEKVLSSGIKKVGLLGTRYTMEQDFFTSRLEKMGIEVIVPGKADRDIVDRVIFEELCVGEISQGSRYEYKRIIAGLGERGAQGIILGCTEIGLLVRQEDSKLPLFDTTAIHAKGALEYSLEIL
jgi:aspartate racemase